ncbi:hypothetical protein F7725_025401 [Dissostichus mawsoni]|uniref:Chitin synthase n=1 Tax=Dissostichus mawsoni TaxID=36200 RepID=A0A7J5XC82_DISMA|nr:hypothetical protein F7725_025401 [Dissostichus mawsoni]
MLHPSLYLASLAVMVLFIVPVIVYYQYYKTGLNGTAINFTGYCSEVVDGRNQKRTGSVFQHLVYDVTHTLCFLDMSKILDIGLLTGAAVFWWLGLVLATVHIWYLSLFTTLDPIGQVRVTCHVNQYAEILVETIREVYSIFVNIDKGLFQKQQHLPDQKIVTTPTVWWFTTRTSNSYQDHLFLWRMIRHKKRWCQVEKIMPQGLISNQSYLYYLLGWKVATKYYKRSGKGGDKEELKKEFQKEKNNTYLLALDGDTDFQPAAVMLLIDRLKTYPRVGAACGRIHPTGSGPLVWYQKFEYAVGHWLQRQLSM